MPAFGGDPLKELAWSTASAQAFIMQIFPHETGGEGEEGPGAARGRGGKGSPPNAGTRLLAPSPVYHLPERNHLGRSH